VAVALPARRRRRDPGRWVVLGLLVAFLIVVLAPFAIVAMNALKTRADLAANGPLSLPTSVTLRTIRDLWQLVDYDRVLLNSVLISGLVAIFGVTVSVLSAYALGIGRVRGRLPILVVFVMANTLPQEGIVYPLYYLAKQVGLYDSRLAIIIIFTTIQGAFGTYLLASVFSTFPRELLEAAAIDGESKWSSLWRIVVPLSWPTISVLFTFFFIWTWNEFFLPLVFLISNDKQTVPVALGVLQGQHMVDQTAASASAVLGVVPTLLFFVLFQRTMTRGITAGALK
jgi:raffinose/stachyose/melibiose transport system permease protein